MKVSNSVFLLLACASVASSIYASAPAASSTSSSSIASAEVALLTAAKIKKIMHNNTLIKLMREKADYWFAKKDIFAKEVLKIVPDATPSQVYFFVKDEINERINKDIENMLCDIACDAQISSNNELYNIEKMSEQKESAEAALKGYLSGYDQERDHKYIGEFTFAPGHYYVDYDTKKKNEQADWQQYKKKHCGIQ